MIDQILLQTVLPSTAGAAAYSAYCTFAGSGVNSLDANNWVGILEAVLAIVFALAAVLYATAGIFPTMYREKIKGAMKYEAFQAIISCFILVILVTCSAGLCDAGQALVAGSTVAQYQNPIQFSEAYVSGLLFGNAATAGQAASGLQLFNVIYHESVILTLTGNAADALEQLLPQITGVSPFVGISFGTGLLGLFYGFAGAITSTFLGLIAVTFGVLFIVYLMLPFIQQLAFTVVLPLALVLRSVPFAGPNLRQTSDTFLALAVGFYLILPLTLLLNNFIITWIYTPCTPVGNPPALCNPYQQYTDVFQVGNLPTEGFFSQSYGNLQNHGFAGVTNIPSTFYGSSFDGLGGLGQGIEEMLEALYDLPQVIINFSVATALYLFEGIFLIGMDFAITVAFAMGLSKGLSSVGRMLGVGPFWGGY